MNSEIRSFSSYTKGLYSVSDISRLDEFVEVKLRFSSTFQSKLERRIEKFGCSAISIDGVYAQISRFKLDTVIAKIANELFLKSSLVNLKNGNQVSIGLLSNNPEKYLLASTPASIVTLVSVKVATGHTFTKELKFECSKDMIKHIQNLQYVGLNASGVFLRDIHQLEDHCYFSIHAGKQTRENTVFGQDNLELGREFTLTLPFKI